MKRPLLRPLLVMGLLLMGQMDLLAQSGNGTYLLLQEMVSSGGGQVGGGNPMSAQTVLGLPAAGAASNAAFSLIGGMGTSRTPEAAPITMTVTVTGTTDDPTASIMINGTPATLTGTTFSADNVLLALGPNTLTATVTDSLGNTASQSITVYLDLPQVQKMPRFSIEVRGTTDDPTATVSVNGVPAPISTGQFSAVVPLVSGLNTLTAVATDGVGNTRTVSIRVFVPLPSQPPARPTVGTIGTPPPSVTTASSLIIGGTKTAGTSIWMNGTQVVSLDQATTWTATVTLSEGDNDLAIVAKDAGGTASAAVTITIILDNLPPVVTFQPPAKTNLNPLTLHGSVDDSQTVVTINGLTAARTKRDFEVSVPLTLGANAVRLTAVSPNGYTTTKDYTVTLGTIPTIQSVQPPDGTILYSGTAVTLQISAADQENDPIQYQVLLDQAPLSAWSANGSPGWTPTAAQLGLHTLQVNVRDDYDGSNSQEVEVFVLHPPLQPQ